MHPCSSSVVIILQVGLTVKPDICGLSLAGLHSNVFLKRVLSRLGCLFLPNTYSVLDRFHFLVVSYRPEECTTLHAA
jgi:hypothetical protein